MLCQRGVRRASRDPLGEMQPRRERLPPAYMVSSLLGAIGKTCRVGLLLEGGYDLTGLESLSKRTVEALLGNGPDPILRAHLPTTRGRIGRGCSRPERLLEASVKPALAESRRPGGRWPTRSLHRAVSRVTLLPSLENMVAVARW